MSKSGRERSKPAEVRQKGGKKTALRTAGKRRRVLAAKTAAPSKRKWFSFSFLLILDEGLGGGRVESAYSSQQAAESLFVASIPEKVR
jgi:hypothetical protein